MSKNADSIHDSIRGQAGNDTIRGDDGNDTISGDKAPEPQSAVTRSALRGKLDPMPIRELD